MIIEVACWLFQNLLGIAEPIEFHTPDFTPLETVVNIFAWVSAFLPVDTIWWILGTTAAWYAFALVFKLVKLIISFILG